MRTLPQLLDLLGQYSTGHPFPADLPTLYEPCTYMLSLGGKRLRPALTLMGYELFQQDVETALPAAWAVELFHNFSLIHDDIMDAAPLRRGQPTVHTRWNNTTGILSGDAMLIYAYKSLASVQDKAVVPALLDSFNKAAIEVCEGQQKDVDFETQDSVSIDAYIDMICLKTAVLLGCALEMGAICAGASVKDATNLYEFGRLAGISFQIQDDLLDTYGDPALFGKQVGGDILQNKKTLLVLKALETAPQHDVETLRGLFSQNNLEPAQKIEAVKDIFDRNKIPELVGSFQAQYEKSAFRHLDEVSVSEDRKRILRQSIQDLFIRAH